MADKHSVRVMSAKYEGSQRKLVVVAFCALVGAVNFGIAIGYSSPAIPTMIKRGIIASEESGWFGSLLTIGAVIGGPLGGVLIQKLGRRLSLIAISVPFAAGFFMMGSASAASQCFLGRFLTGIGSGMVTVCVPMYIAEISTTSMRGILGSSVQLSITVGIAGAYIAGAFLGWRSLAYLCVVPSVIGGLLTVFIPESPRWLIMNNRKADALQALKCLRDPHTDVNEECRDLEDGTDPEEKVSITEMLSKRELSYPLFLVICIMIFQQLSGINAVMFYTVTIFESAVGDMAYTATIIIGLVQIVATLAGVYLMDRAGRRYLLNLGGLIMAGTLFFFGLYYKVVELKYLGDEMKTVIPILCLTLFIVGFSLGWGPVPMLIMAEMIPTKCKGIAGSLAILASWGSAFIVTSQFGSMQILLGNDGIFYFFSACCMVAVIFVNKYIPETKGKSLEDIELYFAGKATVLV